MFGFHLCLLYNNDRTPHTQTVNMPPISQEVKQRKKRVDELWTEIYGTAGEDINVRDNTALLYKIQAVMQDNVQDQRHLKIVYRILAENGVHCSADNEVKENITIFGEYVKYMLTRNNSLDKDDDVEVNRICDVLDAIYQKMKNEIAKDDIAQRPSVVPMQFRLPHEFRKIPGDIFALNLPVDNTMRRTNGRIDPMDVEFLDPGYLFC